MFGLLAAGLVVLTVTSLTLFALERILVGASDPARAWLAWSRGLAVILPIAAVAPAIAHLSTRPSIALSIWVVVLSFGAGVAKIGFPIPLDRLYALGEGGGGWSGQTIVACALATMAGLTVSLALGARRPTGAESPPCASASSATSTATSKH